MDAAKLQTIVDEVHAATSIATEIIAASGIGGNFNEALVERGEDAAFGIVKAALTGYTKATGKTLTPEMVTELLITDAPLEVDPALEPKVGGEKTGESLEGLTNPTPAELAAAPDIIVPTKDEVIAAGYAPEAADSIIAKQEALKVAQEEARKNGSGSAQ